jgi:hypothetical protein
MHAFDGNASTETAPVDGSLVDRGRRLFEFLARAQLLKTPAPRTQGHCVFGLLAVELRSCGVSGLCEGGQGG